MHAVRLFTVATLIAATSLSASAGDKVPNMVGVWRGSTHTVVAGEGGNWVGHNGNFEKPGLFERPFTFEILGQDGRRFWGRSALDGSTGPMEPFVGSLRVDRRQFIVADTDGSFSGTLIGRNKLEYCYLNVPGSVNKAAVASCSVLTRSK